MALIKPVYEWKSWRERIRHFTWAWHAVIMGTGAVSALIHNFPYHNDSLALKVASLIVFLLNLILFVFVCTCTVLRYIMFPEVWGMMIKHPHQSLFIGCFPMGAATLINSALNLNQDWGFGGRYLLWTLWGFWWLDSLVSAMCAFGMLYVMITRQEQSIPKMAATWLLPVVPLIVASSSGGLLSHAFMAVNTTTALVTSAISFSMVVAGLMFALMMITIYLARLITAGLPDPGLILSAFIVLGPLGQGGFSLLVNGQDLSELLPLHMGEEFPTIALAGQMIFAGCFLGAYALFSMGVAWIILAFISIAHVRSSSKLPFSMAYWGIIFPNGVFALLCVQLAKTLNSPVFRAIGAGWTAIVFLFWICVFLRSIPAFIDGSMFMAPYVPALPQPVTKKAGDYEEGKLEGFGSHSNSATTFVAI
ncbi:voltage-dependent anion channel [Epithele typhae]|uniref:voltage-dependent anion channel n=1 Tax=Epithele typhae TaxID=378194 RepID=UPI002008E2D3|nr:voltage-dependent anion channel [Epithele typhae]KAH9931135.1 voltage-dependent anion channel [Epithele typhae]